MRVLAFVKQWLVIHLLFAITFFTSGLIINFFQCILYLGLKPISKYFYRKINYYLCYSFYCQLVFMAEWWAGSNLILYIDKEDFNKYFGNEHGYLLMNHSYETDWLIGWLLCDRVRLLGNCKAYAKKSIQYIPTLGWAWKFAESIFLERSWEKDKENIKLQIKELVEYPDKMWLLLYPEGTRFTPKKLEASQKFAIEKGLPVLKYHLTPRTKGFTASIPHMRGKATAIYDIQIAFKPSDPVKPTMKNLLFGKRLEGYMYAKRIPIEEVPEGDEAAAEWLQTLYQQKDRMAESFYETGDFFATSGVPRIGSCYLARSLALLSRLGLSLYSLKCRSNVQDIQHDQYQKVMQICKARSKTGNNHSNNDSSSEEDDSDDSLSVDLFGTRFFIMNGGNKFSNIQSWKNSNENRYTNGNRKSSHSSHSSNNRDFSYSNGAGKSSYDQMYDNFENYGKQQEQCIIQCFFNELNMVDQRGYPEQVSIIQFMTRNTHNPELQDLIEEAVIECFHYLDSDAGQNACYFSENLLTCLIDKGKERCEDWDD